MSSPFLKNAAYGLLDLVTLKRGVPRRINNMNVRFPARWSRYFTSEYEADNYSFLKSHIKQGMHIIDIGAHIGLFSVCTSQLTGPTGKIVCFEPTPGTFAILKETLRLNHCNNVAAQQAAVGAVPGKATFYVGDEEGDNSNSLVLNKGKSHGYDVTVTTVDKVCQDHNLKPSLVKVDVEGAELDVLKGAVNTMTTTRPLMILGLHPSFIDIKGDSLQQIWDIIKERRYEVIYNDSKMSEADFLSQKQIFDVQLLPL